MAEALGVDHGQGVGQLRGKEFVEHPSPSLIIQGAGQVEECGVARDQLP